MEVVATGVAVGATIVAWSNLQRKGVIQRTVRERKWRDGLEPSLPEPQSGVLPIELPPQCRALPITLPPQCFVLLSLSYHERIMASSPVHFPTRGPEQKVLTERPDDLLVPGPSTGADVILNAVRSLVPVPSPIGSPPTFLHEVHEWSPSLLEWPFTNFGQFCFRRIFICVRHNGGSSRFHAGRARPLTHSSSRVHCSRMTCEVGMTFEMVNRKSLGVGHRG